MPLNKKLGQWLQSAAALVGAAGGIYAIFAFIGFVITQSYVNRIGLYGLPLFAEEFLKESGVQFFSDFAVILGTRWWIFPLFFLLFALLSFLAVPAFQIKLPNWLSPVQDIFKRLLSFAKGKAALIFFIFILAIVFVIVFLNDVVDDPETQRILFFILAVPALGTLGIYLALHFSQIAKMREWGTNGYGAFLTLFVVLLVCVPLQYGRDFFDIPVYMIHRFDCDPAYPSDSLKALCKDINEGSSGQLYFFMGHTKEKEIFFRVDEPPAKIVLVDSAVIKFLSVESSEPGQLQTLRGILAGLSGNTGALGER